MNMSASVHRSAYLVLLLVLAVAPWPLGGNRDWAWPALSTLLTLAALLALFGKPLTLTTHQRISLAAFILLTGWMTLQLFWTFDYYENRSELLKTIMLMSLFLVTFRVLEGRKRQETVIYLVVIVGLMQACLGGMQQLMFDVPRSRGSFPNPNHFAGYLEIVICLAIGAMIALQGHPRSGRPLSPTEMITGELGRLRIAIIIMVVALVMSRSRMGNVAFFSSILITSLLAFYYTRSFNRYTVILLTSILVLDIFIIGNYFGIERLGERLTHVGSDATSRINLQTYNARIVRDHTWTGVGAGSYQTAFSQYRDHSVSKKVTHAENEYAEFLVELGVIGCLPLLIILLTGLHAQVSLLSSMTPPFERGIAFGCLAATVSILIHGIADVNLQIPANSMLFVLALALPQTLIRDRTP
ncbi:MAG: O-antigen ligase family protein [Pseudomonadales bacterium]|nr:O-antigen ligase family protein [Pseudomonadales bacterium]MBO6563504.1 O-antigen ligase family protein [Pseudomonadales bacterium]MBO6597796.1 O-antigen ligase family protein [Pseudomonadales bacterium]MBO6704111.1 O-antigen ligase family protein [Pseudomonadales bacterium]MBO6824034.1 O-antigen ligase family protein [Pseudomonadales bacterium]